eukprot:2664349-Amphidinium_carterae.1
MFLPARSATALMEHSYGIASAFLACGTTSELNARFCSPICAGVVLSYSFRGRHVHTSSLGLHICTALLVGRMAWLGGLRMGNETYRPKSESKAAGFAIGHIRTVA